MAAVPGVSSAALLPFSIRSYWHVQQTLSPAQATKAQLLLPPTLTRGNSSLAMHVVVGQEGTPSYEHQLCCASPGDTRDWTPTQLSGYIPSIPERDVCTRYRLVCKLISLKGLMRTETVSTMSPLRVAELGSEAKLPNLLQLPTASILSENSKSLLKEPNIILDHCSLK